MCGIAGVRRFDGRPVDTALLARMAELLHHRGPDERRAWVSGPVGLVHTRLSIIDLAGSHQPMTSPDGRLSLVFNGEILNYRQLREQSSYPFRTSGDTEVLLAQHVQHGPGGVQRLDGQFAYALVDSTDGSIRLYRDRLGILPLYYYVDDHMLVFASEIKALLPALPSVAVDEDSLIDYLAHRAVPAPHTLFRGVRKVRPGCCVHVTARGSASETRYWGLPATPADERLSPERAVRLVGSELERSVAAALVADVPVGAYLSGGVDSSLVTALMCRLREGEPVSTFAAGFGDRRLDELPWARQVSERLGTVHHEVVVTPDDFAAEWHRLTWHRDAPISEPADIAVARLAALARQHVTVVLSGEGSDELFAGYPKYRAARWADLVGVLPDRMRRPLLSRLEDLLPASQSRLRVAVRAAAAATAEERLRAWFAPFTEQERTLLAGRPARPAFTALAGSLPGDVVRRMQHLDCRIWLADNLLERGDRMSMAASLELRPPFLDHHLVELAFRLPTSVKLRHGTTKWVVKEVARQYLPAAVVDRPKAGFRVPLEAWFRTGLRDLAWDQLTGSQSFVATVFDSATVRRLLTSHDSGRRNEEMRLWTLLCLEVWHDVFFGAGRTTSPAPSATPADTGRHLLELAWTS